MKLVTIAVEFDGQHRVWYCTYPDDFTQADAVEDFLSNCNVYVTES